MPERGSLLVLYHYLYPDEVVSSIHLSELCTGLAARGWEVAGIACNRGCRDESKLYPRRSRWRGVEFRHLWRPPLAQNSTVGRLLNAVWMIGAWSLAALHPRLRPDVIVVGTDPVMSPVVALCWRFFRPRTRLVHWCFDLYPEAALVDGMLRKEAAFVRFLRWLLRASYHRFDLLVDIGECMRRRLALYGSSASTATIVPWALAEPGSPAGQDPEERRMLFGDARLGLLYSGNFGRAHSYSLLPELAAALEPHGGRLAFSVGANAAAQLRSAFTGSGLPVIFTPLCSVQELERRLGAADVHVVTLKEDWTGTVVPSKFFGALAMGRPVLFAGSPDSAISRWIREFRVGWVLDRDSLGATVQELRELATAPEKRQLLFAHCQEVYRREFSRERCLARWDNILTELIAVPG